MIPTDGHGPAAGPNNGSRGESAQSPLGGVGLLGARNSIFAIALAALLLTSCTPDTRPAFLDLAVSCAACLWIAGFALICIAVSLAGRLDRGVGSGASGVWEGME